MLKVRNQVRRTLKNRPSMEVDCDFTCSAIDSNRIIVPTSELPPLGPDENVSDLTPWTKVPTPAFRKGIAS